VKIMTEHMVGAVAQCKLNICWRWTSLARYVGTSGRVCMELMRIMFYVVCAFIGRAH